MYYAQALKLNHRLNESIPYFIEGLADNEKDQEHQLYIYGELITALIDIKRYDEALDWCDKAEKDFPTIGLWSFKRCRLYVILEQWGKVIECFEKGFELEMPDETFIAIYPREWDYYPNLSYALALSKLGRYEQACQVIMSTLERYQKDVHLTELLKECLINIKNNMQERKLQ
jgi:tetratricopeptide (TPR) repeat protein